jgi:hypothetical protein
VKVSCEHGNFVTRLAEGQLDFQEWLCCMEFDISRQVSRCCKNCKNSNLTKSRNSRVCCCKRQRDPFWALFYILYHPLLLSRGGIAQGVPCTTTITDPLLIIPDSSTRALGSNPAGTPTSEEGETWRESDREFCRSISFILRRVL